MSKSREGGRLGMMCENPQKKRCRGETKYGRESGCRNRKRRRKNIDKVDADSNQKVGNQKSRGERRTLRGSGEAVQGVHPLWRVSTDVFAIIIIMYPPLGVCE